MEAVPHAKSLTAIGDVLWPAAVGFVQHDFTVEPSRPCFEGSFKRLSAASEAVSTSGTLGLKDVPTATPCRIAGVLTSHRFDSTLRSERPSAIRRLVVN